MDCSATAVPLVPDIRKMTDRRRFIAPRDIRNGVGADVTKPTIGAVLWELAGPLQSRHDHCR
jgi:hypothetical protein